VGIEMQFLFEAGSSQTRQIISEGIRGLQPGREVVTFARSLTGKFANLIA
jgi:hypothetical protein